MKQPKALKLKTKTGNLIEFRISSDEKAKTLRALDKLNSISSILRFNISDFQRMANKDLCDRLLNEKIVITLDIPTRRIIFDLEKTGRKLVTHNQDKI